MLRSSAQRVTQGLTPQRTDAPDLDLQMVATWSLSILMVPLCISS